MKGLGLSQTVGLSASLFIFWSWLHLFVFRPLLPHTCTHIRTHKFTRTHTRSLSPSSLPVFITGKMERTICNSVTFMTVRSLIRGPYFICGVTLEEDSQTHSLTLLASLAYAHKDTHCTLPGSLNAMCLLYNTPVVFHLLLLKAFNFYGGTELSKLCLV